MVYCVSNLYILQSGTVSVLLFYIIGITCHNKTLSRAKFMLLESNVSNTSANKAQLFHLNCVCVQLSWLSPKMSEPRMSEVSEDLQGRGNQWGTGTISYSHRGRATS